MSNTLVIFFMHSWIIWDKKGYQIQLWSKGKEVINLIS